MSKKSNVHPDYYKTAGRDRPDDAARARLNRAIAAKATSQQHPDRMGKLYFERPEPAQPDFDAAADQPKAKTKAAARAGASGKRAAPKTSRPKKAGARKSRTRAAGARKPAAPRRATTTGKAGASRAKKSGKAAARPAKKL